jgi:hypothetical protein
MKIRVIKSGTVKMKPGPACPFLIDDITPPGGSKVV